MVPRWAGYDCCIGVSSTFIRMAFFFPQDRSARTDCSLRRKASPGRFGGVQIIKFCMPFCPKRGVRFWVPKLAPLGVLFCQNKGFRSLGPVRREAGGGTFWGASLGHPTVSQGGPFFGSPWVLFFLIGEGTFIQRVLQWC